MAYRSIEFRGFHPDECGNEKIYIHGKWVNGFWVFGNFVKAEKLDCSECEYLIIEVGVDGRTYDVIPETVGQYINKIDKNGKKIYEDDIVDASEEWWCASGPARHEYPYISVRWNEDETGFTPFAIYDCDCGVYINSERCTVLGTIWDNLDITYED